MPPRHSRLLFCCHYSANLLPPPSLAAIRYPWVAVGRWALDNTTQETVAEGYFLASSVGYRSKYLIDVLRRRDGSSLFGSNQRWQNYYRLSAAWRMAEESWDGDRLRAHADRFSLARFATRLRDVVTDVTGATT